MYHQAWKHPLGLLACVAAVASSGLAAADTTEARSQVWEIARGGQLYDNWAKVVGTPLCRPSTFGTASSKPGIRV